MKWSFIMTSAKHEKSPLTIPVEFVEKIQGIITDKSKEGTEKFAAIAEEAQRKYKDPVDSWITGWLYQFTRTRITQLNDSISAMKKNEDYYTHLNDLRKLIRDGSWESTSYNFYLFHGLIQTIPDYKPLKEESLRVLVHTLRDEIFVKIDILIKEYKLGEQYRKNNDAETAAIKQKSQQRNNDVLIVNDLQSAQAQSKKDKLVFCLIKDGDWQLTLVDSGGKVYSLELTDELAQNLSTKNTQDINGVHPIHLKPIKVECIKAINQYLTRVSLLNAPEQSNEQLVAQSLCSTFVLRNAGKGNELWWIDRLGAINKVALDDYPQISALLGKDSAPLNSDDLLRLKLQLLSVKVTQKINVNLVNQLDGVLAGMFKAKANPASSIVHQVNSVEQAKEKAFARLKLMINPQENNAELMQHGLCATFILRQAGKKNTLWWANSVGVINKIELHAYANLQAWLQQHPEPLTQEDELQLKPYLMQVNTVQALASDKVRALDALLADKFKKGLHGPSAESALKPVTQSVSAAPKTLTAERYSSLAKLPTLWQKKRIEQQPEAPRNSDSPSSSSS